MGPKTPAKVISLSRKNAGESGADRPARPPGAGAHVIAITSGKGGVGKTNIVANLGFAMAQSGKRVLILDADLGLGNLDVMLGIAPRYNLAHVLSGEQPIEAVVVDGPGGLKILPAASGLQDLTRLEHPQRARLGDELDRLMATVDVMLIDTAAGISADVMYFNVSAHDILVVASPEPTSITDAYALMKVLSLRYAERRFSLVVNMARSAEEARDVFRQLKLVADRFLDIEIAFVGHVRHDEHVPRSVMRQKIVSALYPDCMASRCFDDLGRRLSRRPAAAAVSGRAKGFWKHLTTETREPLENI